MTRREQISEMVENSDNNKVIQWWNVYCSEIEDMDSYIYDNSEDFFKTHFNLVMDAIRAICMGEYQYLHDYVRFDGYGHLCSGSDYDMIDQIVDKDDLVEWLDDNYFEGDFEYIVDE